MKDSHNNEIVLGQGSFGICNLRSLSVTGETPWTVNFKKDQWFCYCEINWLVLSFMPSYPTVSLSNSCQHVPIRLSLSLLIILYIVWLLCGIVIKVHVDTLSVRHWLISLTVNVVLQMINFYLSLLNFSVQCSTGIKVHVYAS